MICWANAKSSSSLLSFSLIVKSEFVEHFAVVKHLMKKDTYTTSRTKKDIEGEQILFKNENNNCSLSESISLEMAAPKDGFPLQFAELVSPPLIGHSSLKVEGKGASPCCSCDSSHWADHL